MAKDIHVRFVISPTRSTSPEVFLNVYDHPVPYLLKLILVTG